MTTITQALGTAGWITTAQAAQETGRTGGGSFPALLRSRGVRWREISGICTGEIGFTFGSSGWHTYWHAGDVKSKVELNGERFNMRGKVVR